MILGLVLIGKYQSQRSLKSRYGTDFVCHYLLLFLVMGNVAIKLSICEMIWQSR